jgi:hypothetical protein
MSGKPTPILNGVLNDLAQEVEAERALAWLAALPDPIHHQHALSPDVRYLYILLRDYASAHPGAHFPTQAELAFVMRASVRSVRTWMRKLEHAGPIRTTRHGLGLSNSYDLSELPEVR